MRWPPHINLLYPFIDDRGTAFSDAAHTARDSLAAVQPFEVCSAGVTAFKHQVLWWERLQNTQTHHVDILQVTLRAFGHFEHGRSCTLWLDPDSQGAPEAHWSRSCLGTA